MINKIKQFLTFFVVLTTFLSAFPINAFAVNEGGLQMTLKKTRENDIFYVDTTPLLNPLPLFFSDYGDMDVSINNPFCLAYAGLYIAAMYKGNNYVRIAATAALVAAVSGVYVAANVIYKNYEICGADWLIWGTNNESEKGGNVDIIRNYPIRGAFKGSGKYKTLETIKKGGGLTMSNQAFRQYIYNGEEIINNGCTDPRPERRTYDIGGKGQTYYMRGIDAGNFACERFGEGRVIKTSGLSDSEFIQKKQEYSKAYDCCKKASNSICLSKMSPGIKIVNDNGELGDKFDEIASSIVGSIVTNFNYKFFIQKTENVAKLGNLAFNFTVDNNVYYANDAMYDATLDSRIVRTKIGDFCDSQTKLCIKDAIVFEIFKGQEQNQAGLKYCVRTWSLCPYNFNIQKGTEKFLSFKNDVDSFRYVRYSVLKNTETGVQRVVEEDVKPERNEFLVDTIENIEYTMNDECSDPTTKTSYPCKGKPRNFYQLDRHCTVVQEFQGAFARDEIDYAPFVDKSCMNMVGSSHNTPGYRPYYSYDKNFAEYKVFSAPIAECITETLRNFMLNRAGHTRCAMDEQTRFTPPPSGDGSEYCGSTPSSYEYRMGDDLSKIESKKVSSSPTEKVLSRFHQIIIVASMLMVAFYGISILLKGGEMDRKSLTIAALKLAVVLAFSSGTWWYDYITQFTYSVSRTFTEIVNKFGIDSEIDERGNYIRYDGCYFGNPYNFIENREIDNISGRIPDDILNNNYFEYPTSRRYISFFDTLDCKIYKYFGYSSFGSVPKIISTIAMSVILSPNNLFIAVGTLLIALFAINFMFIAAYTFIAANVAITMLLYVAPLMIPMFLFEKTKKTFEGWLTKLLGYCIYPMMLFVYISISMAILDKYMLGEGIFVGEGISKQLVCGYSCKDAVTNNIIKYDDKFKVSAINFERECTGNLDSNSNEGDAANRFINISEASVLCFMKEVAGQPWSALYSIGVFLVVGGDQWNRLVTIMIMIIRAGFLFFILTKMLKSIPSIAEHITSAKLVPDSGVDLDPFAMNKKVINAARTVSRVAAGAARKATKTALSAANTARGAVGNLRGKIK